MEQPFQDCGHHQVTKDSNSWKIRNQCCEPYNYSCLLHWKTPQVVEQKGRTLCWRAGAESPGKARQPEFIVQVTQRRELYWELCVDLWQVSLSIQRSIDQHMSVTKPLKFKETI